MTLNSSSSKLVTGIDFGETNIKVVCLKKNEDKLHLLAHGLFKRENLDQVRAIIQSREVKKGIIRVNIEDASIKIRCFQVPPVPEKEIPELVRWGLKDVIRGKVEDFQFRYHKLPTTGFSNKTPHLVYAVEKQALAKHLLFLKSLGISRPQIVEPNASALSVSLTHNHTLESSERAVFIDFGSSITLYSLICHEGLLFSRPLGGVSGQSLTRQISRDFGIKDEEAETLKQAYRQSNDSSPADKKLKNSVANFLSKMAIEIQRSLDSSLTQSGADKISKVFITGGGSLLDGLQDYISKTLCVEAQRFEPFTKIDPGQFLSSKGWNQRKYYYSLACGLAAD